MKSVGVLIGMFALVGCGAQQFAVESGSEEFGQQVTYSKEVDVLWVVDTSAVDGETPGLTG